MTWEYFVYWLALVLFVLLEAGSCYLFGWYQGRRSGLGTREELERLYEDNRRRAEAVILQQTGEGREWPKRRGVSPRGETP